MWRYLRLFAYFVQFSFSRAMEFRLDFFFRIVMDSIYYLVNIFFYKILFLSTPALAGWSEPQALVFVSGYLLVDAINMTLFSNNTWWIPIFINRGDLDYYLVRPVSSLFFLSLRDFAANSFMNLIMAAGIFAWAIQQYPQPVSIAKVAMYIALIFNGAFLYNLIHLLALIPTFWTHSGRGFEQVFYSLSKSQERPDRIFRGWVRVILTTVLPFSVISSFPAKLFLESFDWITFGHLLAVTLGTFLATVWIWNLGLRSYSSASS